MDCSAGRNGFGEQLIQQEEQGGVGFAGLTRGGGGGSCCGQRSAHQPSLPVSGDWLGWSFEDVMKVYPICNPEKNYQVDKDGSYHQIMCRRADICG